MHGGTMKTIIYVHPWEGSFNASILQKVREIFETRHETYQVIDLYHDGFDPVFHANELKEFSQGTSPNELVNKYQKIIQETDELIFIFPIWWYSVPAVLKGFLDKILLKGFSYTETKYGMRGHLDTINSVTIITTGQSPKWYIRLFKGDGIKGTLINGTLKSVGMKRIRWIHEGYITSSSRSKKEAFLLKLNRYV